MLEMESNQMSLNRINPCENFHKSNAIRFWYLYAFRTLNSFTACRHSMELPISGSLNLLSRSSRPPRAINSARVPSKIALILFLILLVNYFTIPAVVSATDPVGFSAPAEFVRELGLPGAANHWLRPAAIFVDRNFDELFVADPAHNRVLILDSSGTFRHEFSGGDHFSMPRDVAVDSKGQIYIVGSTIEGRRLFQFDFDGLFIREFDITGVPDSTQIEIGTIALDAEDNLYIYDVHGIRVVSFDSEGKFRHAFRILGKLSEELRREQVVGSISVGGGRIFIPVGSLGTVEIYSLDGQFLRTIGYKGNNIGELNFPVAATLTNDDLLLILDKHRYAVVCFTLEGKFLGEFGGKGYQPGWFYHPTLLAVDNQDMVYIGQIFLNRIQACRIPQFIYDRAGISGGTAAMRPQGNNTNNGSVIEDTDASRAEVVSRDSEIVNTKPKGDGLLTP